MFECMHCGERAVVWDGDFTFEDYGEEGEGIIHECTCSNCGAMITYRIPLDVLDQVDSENTDATGAEKPAEEPAAAE